MGDVRRCSYLGALERCGVLPVLAAFGPLVAGTAPLGLDLANSDIDVHCFAPDSHAFADAIWRAFANAMGFTIKQRVAAPRAVVASFWVTEWRIELYGEANSVAHQRGWRHFDIERRLLGFGGADLRAAVLELRRQGMKTEPAFAEALGLAGDPYLTLLDLAEQGDDFLVSVLRAKGFATMDFGSGS